MINTTAQIYKQGLITAYRMPQITQHGSISSNAASVYAGYPMKMHLMPPSTAARALLLPGAKQWEAARGSYSVFTMVGTENPFVGPDNDIQMYAADFTYQAVAASSTDALVSSTTTANGYKPTVYDMPYNTSGVYLTGLSNQTTLQVNLKMLIEVAPGPLDAFATIAVESPEYDSAAIALYSKIVSRLPPAVPADMNPDGEFYQNVLETLGSLVQHGSLIHPAFGLLGGGLKLAGKAAPVVVRALTQNKQVEVKPKTGKQRKKVK